MKSEKAFTLVEVILAIGIFAIVAVPIVSMFLDGIRVASKTENTSEAYAYAQQYVEKLKGGEIAVIDGATGTIDATEYTYLINVKSKTQTVRSDGEDFYKYMKDEVARKILLTDEKFGSTDLDSFDNIEIGESCNWQLKNGNVIVTDVGVANNYISVNDSKAWIVYNNLTEPKELKINNKSGKQLNIYLQSTEANKNNLKIKNMGGIINVHGPVVGEIPVKSGRKTIANVTVTVENARTGEHAELTANVTYYE